jgi:hypothetical protein
MDPVQPPGPDAFGDPGRTEAECQQLISTHDAVLAPREGRQKQINGGARRLLTSSEGISRLTPKSTP